MSGAKERMLQYLPWYYQSSRVMNAILYAQGNEVDCLLAALDQILEQQFISSATWGLAWWEEALGLPISEHLSLEERRARIMSKRRGVTARLLTVLRAMAPSLQGRFGGDIITFYLPTEHNASEFEFGSLVPVIELCKPAHKAYAFELLPPDDRSGYVAFVGHRTRGLVTLEPEAGSVYAGRWPHWSARGALAARSVIALAAHRVGTADWPFAGIGHGARTAGIVRARYAPATGVAPYRTCGVPEPTGQGASRQAAATVTVLMRFASQPFRLCGTFRAGEAA